MTYLTRVLSITALLLAAGPALADAAPNTLTPAEVSAGWILLFDGETPFGWMTV